MNDERMALATATQARLDKIVSIRNALNEGTYFISSLQLADRLLSTRVLTKTQHCIDERRPYD